MTTYDWIVEVCDNQGNYVTAQSCFETGRMGLPWKAHWVEPVQIPTEKTTTMLDITDEDALNTVIKDIERDYAEFRPVQYLRLPFEVKAGLRSAVRTSTRTVRFRWWFHTWRHIVALVRQ